MMLYDDHDPEAERAVEQRKDLFLSAARNLLAHRDAGRACDPESIKWAEGIVARCADAAEPRRAA